MTTKLYVFICTLVCLSASFARADQGLEAARVRSSLMDSLKAHELAVEFHAWRNSGKTPEDTIQKLSIQATGAESLEIICSELHHLSVKNLSFFADALAQNEKIRLWPCYHQMIKKTQEYWTRASRSIEQRAFTYLKNQFSTYGNLKNSSFGPSRSQKINTNGGPVFVTGDLAPYEVALTFDDGPHPSLTEQLLDILQSEKVTANFFVVGKRTRQRQNILKQTAQAGHIIGNHSQSHIYLPNLSQDDGIEEIEHGFGSVLHTLGYSAPFFRFPFGAKTNFLSAYLKQNDVSAFYWNIDTLDWKEKDPERLYTYALEQVERAGRGIILFHDIQPQTIVMMPAFLRTLKAKGYQPVVYEPIEWIQ